MVKFGESLLIMRELTRFKMAILICLVFSSFQLISQSKNALYLEALGNGVVYSINYDWRFSKSMNGLGLRFGFGGFYAQDDVLLSVPVLFNRLWGKRNHYLETAAGFGYYRFPDNIIGDYDYDSFFAATFSLNYRYQPSDGGLMFKAGWTPVVSDKITEWNWVGIGVGIALK